jgi:two-component system, NarL family, sensor kinase
MDAQQDLIFKIILIAAAVIGGTVFYFIYSMVRQQQKLMKWQALRIKAEIDTIENERRRIAADLHDEIGPMLSAVKLQINHLEPMDVTEKAALEKSSSQIDHVIQRFREISYDLLPNTLIRKGLINAVADFIHRMREAGAVIIEFNPAPVSLSQEKEINVFRIIQEIVHNTIKHAKAAHLMISIRQERETVLLTATDDGVGFIYEEKMQHGSGLGLLNLQNRIEVLNGKLTVVTGPGKGTHYSIEIPEKQ